MATVKEKDLPMAISISSSDYVRIVTSDGASELAFVSDITNIVEEGTITAGSVTWEYRKYKSGALEMWGSATTTLAISTASGSLYTTASTYDIAMPSFVNSCEFVTAELSGGGWVDITDMTNPPKMRFYAPTSFSSASRFLRYYFKGTWV